MTSVAVNCRATIFRFLNVLLTLWLIACCAAVTAAPPVVEQVRQALDIAERAAEHGLNNLSMTAVRRALEFGLPTVAVSQQPVTLVHSGARIDTSAALPMPPLEAIRLRIPQTVLHLVGNWRSGQNQTISTEDDLSVKAASNAATNQQIFETFKQVVLPPQRPHEVFLYSLPVQADALQPAKLPYFNSVAEQLIATGLACDQLKLLQQQLVDSGAERVAEGRLLQLLCCISLQDAAGIQQHSEALSQMLQSGARRETALLAAAAGQNLLNSGTQVLAASAVLSASAKTLAAIQQHDNQHQVPLTAVLLMAARGEFAADRPDNATQLLQLCLQQSGDGRNQAPRSRHQHLIAQQLVARQQLTSAAQILGENYVQNFTKRWLNTAVPLSATGANSEPTSNTSASGQTAAASKTQNSRTAPASKETASKETASKETAAQNTAQPRPVPSIVAAGAEDRLSTAPKAWIWIYALDTMDGTSKPLFAVPDFQHVDHLAVSSDGQQLAFDATFPGEPMTSSGAIYTVDLQRLQLQHLGPGIQPSWSPLGRRLVCNRFSPDRGVWILRTDGSHAVLLDGAGWSSLWSPDGSKIAYTRSVGERSEFMIYNVVEDDFASVATGKKVSPAQSSWNFCWTPDSQQLLVEAYSPDAPDSADQSFIKVNADPSQPVTQLQRRSQEWNEDFAFNADASRLLLAFKPSKSGSEQLAEISPSPSSQPVALSGQAADRRNTSPVWLPDGRTVLYISRAAK